MEMIRKQKLHLEKLDLEMQAGYKIFRMALMKGKISDEGEGDGN